MDNFYKFYYFVSAFAISQILLILAKILSSKEARTPEYLFCALLFCVGIYLTQPLMVGEQLSTDYSLQLIWQHLPTAVPALFLLCSASIFLDDFQLRPTHSLAFIFTMLPPLFFDVFAPNTGWSALLLLTLPQGLEFLFLLSALWIVWKSGRNDLVESRRRFRVLVMGFAGTIILVVITAQQLSDFSDEQVDLLHYPIATLFLIALNLFLLKLDGNVLLFKEAVQGEKLDETESMSSDLALLSSHMLNQESFLDENLTITQLAWNIKIPEYRLRQTINQELGFRNFNEYLNSYRVEAACQKLADSNQAITEIADSVGFNSLSAFNRAFKKIHQITPSEYRKRGFLKN